jgi:hypothetical protein
MTSRAIVALALLAAASSLGAQAASMRPGRYEMTAQFAFPGRATNMAPHKDSVCVTEDDLKDWSKNLVKTGGDATCKLTDYTQKGQTLTFVRQCTARGKTTSYNGQVTFAPPDSYRAVVKIGGGNDSGPLAGSTIAISATRLGACDK